MKAQNASAAASGDVKQSIWVIRSRLASISGAQENPAWAGLCRHPQTGMLQTAGRFMTLPNGARMKGIPLDVLRARLVEAGFEPVG